MYCAVVHGSTSWGCLAFGVSLYLARYHLVGRLLAFLSIAAISMPAFYLATLFIDVAAM